MISRKCWLIILIKRHQLNCFEILWKLSQKPTFMSTRHNTEISAVSHQSALHICFSATGWVCSIKLRDSSFTQRELAYILTSATCRSAWHVDIAESRAQDISAAFVMHFSRSQEKLFSFWKDKYSCPHRGPLPFQCCALEAAKFLRKCQAHSPYP